MYQDSNQSVKGTSHDTIIGNKSNVVTGRKNQSSNSTRVSHVDSYIIDGKHCNVAVSGSIEVHNSRAPLEQLPLLNDQAPVNRKCHSSLKIAECPKTNGNSVITNYRLVERNSRPTSTLTVSSNQNELFHSNLFSDYVLSDSKDSDIRIREFDPSEMKLDLKSTSRVVTNRKGKKFPFKMWDLVNDPFIDCIKWDETGKIITIQVYEFIDRFLPSEIFMTSNYASFVRQMNIYGFRKVREYETETNQGIVRFFHKHFSRGNEQQVMLIKRTANKPIGLDVFKRGRPIISDVKYSKGIKRKHRSPNFGKERHETRCEGQKIAVEQMDGDLSDEEAEFLVIEEEPLWENQCFINDGNMTPFMVMDPTRSNSRVLSMADQQQMKWRRKWDQVLSHFEDEIDTEMDKEDETLKFINSLI